MFRVPLKVAALYGVTLRFTLVELEKPPAVAVTLMAYVLGGVVKGPPGVVAQSAINRQNTKPAVNELSPKRG